MSETQSKEIQTLLHGCLKQEREAQKKLYQLFYGYAMSICIRYAKDAEEAKEVLNDGFMKVFLKLNQYDSEKSFKGWLRRILINTALDHYRHNLKHYQTVDLAAAEPQADTFDVLQKLNYDYLIGLVQLLSPAYRTVFNLYALDGYTHEEIGEMLGISAGTSKSNLAKARMNLRAMLKKRSVDEYNQYV